MIVGVVTAVLPAAISVVSGLRLLHERILHRMKTFAPRPWPKAMGISCNIFLSAVNIVNKYTMRGTQELQEKQK